MARELRPQGGSTSWSWDDLSRCCVFTYSVAGGESADHVSDIQAGFLTDDMRIDKVGVSLENAPGADKTVTVTVSDGTTTMTAEVSGETDKFASSTTNAFDLDVSAKTLSVQLTSTAGAAAGTATIWVTYHTIANL